MRSACCHINDARLAKASSLLTSRQLIEADHDIACVECGHTGDLRSYLFQRHLLDNQHFICLRLKHPVELYCSFCGDFRYSEKFDALIGAKRKLSLSTTATTTCSLGEVQRNKLCLPKGICNMGSTCFLGSVLQVFMRNSVVRYAFRDKSFDNCTKLPKVADSNDKDSTKSKVMSRRKTNGCIACDLKALVEDLAIIDAPGDAVPLIPSNLLHSVWNYADYLAGYDQQDAHEFFIALLDGLEAHASMFHYNGAGAEPIATVGKMVQEGVTDADEDSIAEGLTSSLSSSEAFTSRQSAADEDGVCTEELNFDRTPDAPETFPNVAAMGHSKAGMAGEVLSQTPHLPTKSASFVKSIFSGVTQSVLICNECGNRSEKFETFLDLNLSLEPFELTPKGATAAADCDVSFPFPEHSSHQQQEHRSRRPVDAHVDIRTCLRNFTCVENLSSLVMCEVCQTPRPCKKQLSIATPPQVLVLQLKRFDPIRQLKLCNKVDFPLKGLDLSPFVRPRPAADPLVAVASSTSSEEGNLGGCAREKQTQIAEGDRDKAAHSDQLLYDLCGLVSHTGSLTQGHYISYVQASVETPARKNPDKIVVSSDMNAAQYPTSPADCSYWLKCDDETVDIVSDDEVANAEGYLLFYTLRQTEARTAMW